MEMTPQQVRSAVTEFYQEMPFNFRETALAQAAQLRRLDPLGRYPPLNNELARKPRLLDVGCGTGWLVNGAALHHGWVGHGIDVTPAPVERARAVARQLNLGTTFDVADVFSYQPIERFGLVTSIGVLHHTHDCLGGIAHICNSLVADKGAVFIGLYHSFGREPFIRYFENKKQQGASEDALYAEFSRLCAPQRSAPGGPITRRDTPGKEDTFLRSWFRDQVMHPYETWHTLAEVLPVLESLGFALEATSINEFMPLPADIGILFQQEKRMAEDGRKALALGRYFPGFFVFMARRKTVQRPGQAR